MTAADVMLQAGASGGGDHRAVGASRRRRLDGVTRAQGVRLQHGGQHGGENEPARQAGRQAQVHRGDVQHSGETCS